MVKINREYLDPALRALGDYTQIEIGRLHSKRKAHDAIAEAISSKAKASYVVKKNLSLGAMIFLILLGLGLLGQISVKSIFEPSKPESRPASTSLAELISAPNIEPNITKAVTVFYSTAGRDINPLFSEITAGHSFEDVYNQFWSNAYCYVHARVGGQILRVNLSSYDSFEATIHISTYVQNSNYSASDMTRARERCPYQRSDF